MGWEYWILIAYVFLSAWLGWFGYLVDKEDKKNHTRTLALAVIISLVAPLLGLLPSKKDGGDNV